VSDFKAAITLLSGAENKLLNAKGEENTTIVTTGSVLAVYDAGTLIASYEVVIYGDVSGDGKINILDAIRVNRHTIGMNTIKGCYLEAADPSKDGKVNIIDSITINRYTIGLATINQR